jgi:hypothetical protein
MGVRVLQTWAKLAEGDIASLLGVLVIAAPSMARFGFRGSTCRWLLGLCAAINGTRLETNIDIDGSRVISLGYRLCLAIATI